MNDMILIKMREGDWGEVVRLLREEYGPSQGASHRSGTRYASSADAAMHSFADAYHLPPFYREFEDVYRQLYWYYGICNQYGWGGMLPPVALILNRSRRPTRVAGYARSYATSVNGVPYHAISLTLNICARGNTESLMALLLHEMTHIWQFAKGQRGGHGKGFRNEMLRLGLDEAGQRVRNGSAADCIGREAEMRYPLLAARLRECLASPYHSSKGEDFAFFRLMLGSYPPAA